MVVVAGSLGCLVGGILWPGIAESLLRVLLASLALGWVAARALGAGLPTATTYKRFSPFDGVLADAPRPATPDVVERRARTVSAADDPNGGSHRPIPWPVTETLLRETARRLEQGRRLRLDRPDDVARIRSTVSESTRTLLGLGDPGGPPGSRDAKERVIPLARLDDILDDLERL
jgi:hypothetical protein